MSPWTDAPLITADVIEDLLIATVVEHHAEHLAAHERRRGLDPQTLQRLVTVSHLSDQGTRQSGDALPSCLIGFIGTADAPDRNEFDRLDLSLAMGIEVAVVGQNRRDTLRRRDWTTWTVLECLLQRLPRTDLITSVQIDAIEPVAITDGQRIRGESRVVLTVWVPDAMSLTALPPSDTSLTPGTPGGPPADPYTVPISIGVATDIDAEIVREPITP